jgi:hypothetical protein
MVWSNPFVKQMFDLRMDPFERADENSNNYQRWWIRHAFLLVPARRDVPRSGGWERQVRSLRWPAQALGR